MSLIPDEHRGRLKAELEQGMINPITLIYFTQEIECNFCAQTRQLVQELAQLSDKIKLEIHDFVADAEKAKQLGIDKIPGLAIIGERDYGIRIFGFPYGYELNTLVEAVLGASRGKTDMQDKTKELLSQVKIPIHVQVFVTLTCPHCPVAAATSLKFAVESQGQVRVDIVDAQEFPQIAMKYSLLGVPKTVINEKVEFIGVLPEDLVMEHILLAVTSA